MRSLKWLLSQYAGETGLSWFSALEDAILSLTEFPERCPLAPEDASFPFEVRHLLYGNSPHVYRILFTGSRYYSRLTYSTWTPLATQTVVTLLPSKIWRVNSADQSVSDYDVAVEDELGSLRTGEQPVLPSLALQESRFANPQRARIAWNRGSFRKGSHLASMGRNMRWTSRAS